MTNMIIEYLLKNNIISDEEIDVYCYGIFVIWFNCLCILTSIFIGVIMNRISFILTYLFFFCLMRILIGGFHCKTPIKCFSLFQIINLLVILYATRINICIYKVALILFGFVLVYQYCTTIKETKIPIITIVLYFVYFSLFFYEARYSVEIGMSILVNLIFFILSKISIINHT